MRIPPCRPVLFVHYSPSLLTLHANYVEVAFPAERAFGSRFLRKMAWTKLRDGATMAEKVSLLCEEGGREGEGERQRVCSM